MPNAKKITLDWSETGKTVYCIIRREIDSYRLNDADGSFALNPTDPYLSLVEDSVIKGRYEVSESRTTWNDGKYTIAVYKQAGVSPAPASDTIVGTGEMFISIDFEMTIKDIQDTLKIKNASINDPSPTTTKFITNLTEATNDYWNNAAILFTTGNNTGVIRSIKDYDGTTKEVTLNTALPVAPSNGNAFSVIMVRAFKLAGLEMQEIRDAMKLAPTAGDPVAGSIDKHVDDIPITKTGYSLSTTSEDAIVTKVWAATTRTLSSFGTLITDIWAYATRKLTSRNIAVGEDIAKEQTLLSGIGTGSILIPGATDDGDTITLYYGNSYDGLQFTLGSAWSAYLGAGNEVYIAAKKRYSDATMLFNVKGTIVDQPTGVVSFNLTPANTTITPSDNYILEVQVIKPDGTIVKSAIIRRLELKDRVRK